MTLCQTFRINDIKKAFISDAIWRCLRSIEVFRKTARDISMPLLFFLENTAHDGFFSHPLNNSRIILFLKVESHNSANCQRIDVMCQEICHLVTTLCVLVSGINSISTTSTTLFCKYHRGRNIAFMWINYEVFALKSFWQKQRTFITLFFSLLLEYMSKDDVYWLP